MGCRVQGLPWKVTESSPVRMWVLFAEDSSLGRTYRLEAQRGYLQNKQTNQTHQSWTELKYRPTLHNDISVNDGPQRQQWSHERLMELESSYLST